jgi:hypothetical protein
MRLASCRFAAVLPILTFSVLALAQGTTPSQTQLLPPASSTAGQVGFAVHVRPGASVQPPFAAPTGTVTLYNGATAVGSPATLSAGSGITSATFAESFGTPDATVAKAASGAVWGDFNEDGLPDLLVYGNAPGPFGQELVQDFLSSTTSLQNGTTPPFTAVAMQQLALPLQPQYGQTLAVLDVDGDGHLDLLAGNTVAYGKGDGTFGRVAVLPALASGYNQTYAVDIDGDGKMDIVAVDTPPAVPTPGTVQYAFTVFHNAGGGNFTAMGPYPLAPSFDGSLYAFYNIFGLSFADVNGDGRIDVLSQSNAVPWGNASTGDRLNVMLNLGPGFGVPKAIDTSTVPNLGFASTSFTDLNNDGKQDLVFSYQAFGVGNNNGVATLLGNGDGTFAAPVNFTIGTSAVTPGSPILPLVTADFNADGKADVVLGSGVLLLGNGDGTLTAGTPLFTSAGTPPIPPPAYAVLTAPPTGTIPGWGSAPLSVVFFINLQAGANAVFLPNIGSSVTASAALPPGTYSLTAHYSGDKTYTPSVSNALSVTTLPVVATVAVTSSANPSYTGEDVTLTATISGLGAPGGSVVFSDGSTALGTVQVSNGVASHKGSFSTAGNHTITAAYSGDANNLAASGTLTQTVDAPISIPTQSGSTTLTVASGSSVSGSITIDAATGYSGLLSLTCSGLPASASCSFTPQIPTIAAPSGTYGIIVATSSPAPILGTVKDSETPPGAVEWCGVSLLGLLLMGRIRRSRVGRLCLVLAAGVFVSLTGCGGGSSKSATTSSVTPPGTYTFQLNAATGQVNAGPYSSPVSQTYTLIVQ